MDHLLRANELLIVVETDASDCQHLLGRSHLL
jgi:hypothetical protein